MEYYKEMSIIELLQLSNLRTRCEKLAQHIEKIWSIRELHEYFPLIVHSLFGLDNNNPLGWGLRAMTHKNSCFVFEEIKYFLCPQGPLFNMCYRLLNDGYKFEASMEHLPAKIAESLQTGQYSIFYADLLNVDPFRRQVSSLLLNAFDYYMLHFVVHATIPLHKMYPAAMTVHLEMDNTIYYSLFTNYLIEFLPADPSKNVKPLNMYPVVKMPQQLPTQQLAPKRSPKYLKIPQMSLFDENNAPPAVGVSAQMSYNSEVERVHAWRTESIMHFFMDILLRYNVEATRELPSSEFLRVSRQLVKQTHFFANAAYMENATMLNMRKMAQAMLRARIYPLLKSLIIRWPLDNSLSTVLELWFAYLQPWRYTIETYGKNMKEENVTIHQRFDGFISDNLTYYTQIFLFILPRFERLDYLNIRNATMLLRLAQLFCSNGLPIKIYQAEKAFLAAQSSSYDSPRRQSPYLNYNSAARASPSLCAEWGGVDTLYQDDVYAYTPLFSAEVQMNDIKRLIQSIHMARITLVQEICALKQQHEERIKGHGFLHKMYLSITGKVSATEEKLIQISKVPNMLEESMFHFATTFQIELPEMEEQFEMMSCNNCSSSFMTRFNNSEYMDLSRVRPEEMSRNQQFIVSRTDPALYPINTWENTTLVCALHRVSMSINEMFAEEINAYWNRQDFVGKLARQVLYEPMTAQRFDKSKGYSELCETQLPPRVCLRKFASYYVLLLIGLAIFSGYMIWGSPMLGFILLIFLHFLYSTFLALFP